jgi:hypothetical protein
MRAQHQRCAGAVSQLEHAKLLAFKRRGRRRRRSRLGALPCRRVRLGAGLAEGGFRPRAPGPCLREDFIFGSSSGLPRRSPTDAPAAFRIGDGHGLLQIGREAHQAGRHLDGIAAGLAALEPGPVGSVSPVADSARLWRRLGSSCFFMHWPVGSSVDRTGARVCGVSVPALVQHSAAACPGKRARRCCRTGGCSALLLSLSVGFSCAARAGRVAWRRLRCRIRRFPNSRCPSFPKARSSAWCLRCRTGVIALACRRRPGGLRQLLRGRLGRRRGHGLPRSKAHPRTSCWPAFLMSNRPSGLPSCLQARTPPREQPPAARAGPGRCLHPASWPPSSTATGTSRLALGFRRDRRSIRARRWSAVQGFPSRLCSPCRRIARPPAERPSKASHHGHNHSSHQQSIRLAQ